MDDVAIGIPQRSTGNGVVIYPNRAIQFTVSVAFKKKIHRVITTEGNKQNS